MANVGKEWTEVKRGGSELKKQKQKTQSQAPSSISNKAKLR